MFDDDDDGVEPQFEGVNEYYFEDGDEEAVCFSILPLRFGEDDKEVNRSRKDVFLCGLADKTLRVYEKVVAWKIGLDSEQPSIYVLSSKHKWIKLLTPRKCYLEFIQSILVTVQMLHFVRKGGQRCLVHLWDHLDEVCSKYIPKPVEDDLRKHCTLIKRFAEKDRTLMKSKILQRLIKNGFKRTKKALGPERQSIVSGRQRVRKTDDNNYSNKDGSDDGGGSSGGGDDDDDDDDDSNDDDGTDQICAICDDGGDLLSCEGPCKRSFHPTLEDDIDSKCPTLGYTPAEVKNIGTYLCENCKNKQHQCFICGELEPSHGPNAKVFQCCKASCGYFYHPKCIAELLDPNATDGACSLERKIMAGMPFPCPVHWCFKCRRMEDRTQKALKLVVCRRCPRAYHRECLPRELSLGTKDKDGNQRAWKLPKTIFIYCLDHEIDKDTSTPERNHIKFPAPPECTKTEELGNSTDRMIGKRRKNTDQSTKPTESPNRLCRAESGQAENIGANKASPQIVVEPHCAAKRLKGDPQIKQSTIGVVASQNGAETMKEHEKQSVISFCVASTETEKRVTCLVENETCLGTPNDGPSTKGMSDCYVQDKPVDKDVELNNVACRITEDNYANGREKTQEDYTRKENAYRKDSSETQGQNDVLELVNLSVEIHADGSPLESGKKKDKECQENACGLGSASGQETSRRENPRSDREMIPRNDIKEFDYRKSGTSADHFDDHSSEKKGNGSSRSKCNDCLEAIDQGTSSDRSKKRSQSLEKASDGNKTNLDTNKKHNLRKDGSDAHNEDRGAERNTAAGTFDFCQISRDHEIDKDTSSAKRNHLKFPSTPECTKTKELGNSTDRMIGKRRKNTDQSTKPTESPNRLCRAESVQAENIGANKTSPQIVVEPHCAAKRLKGDPQIKQSTVGVVASQNGAETMKEHKKQSGISSCVAHTETEERVTCLVENGTCLGTPNDGPSTKGMSDCIVQDKPVDKDVELDNVACRITEDNYANGREKTQEDYTIKENAHCKDSSENQGQNDVLLVEIHGDGSPLESGKKKDKECQENARGLGSVSGPENETSRRENSRSDREMVPRNDSKEFDYRKVGTTADHFDDGSSRSKCNDCLEAIAQGTSRSQYLEKASDGNKTDLDMNKKHNLRKDGSDAHYEDRRAERNTAAGTFDFCQISRRDHEIDKDTSATERNHIKFPATPECTKTKELGNSTDMMIGKRRKNTDQSTNPTESPNRSCRAESGQAENIGAKKASPQIAVEPHCAAKRLKGDPQIKQSLEKRSQSLEKTSDGNKTDLDENKKHNLRKDGSDAHYEDRGAERNTAAGTFKNKCRDETQSDRREEPVGRNTQTRSREHSPERQRMDRGGSYSGTYDRQRYEWWDSVNSSRSGYDDRRHWSSCQSLSPLAEFGGDQSNSSQLYWTDSQYGTRGRHNPPPYPGRTTTPHPRGPEYVLYGNSWYGGHNAMGTGPVWNGDNSYGHGGYNAMGTGPVWNGENSWYGGHNAMCTGPVWNGDAYRPYMDATVAESSAVRYQLDRNEMNCRPLASRSVTDKYAPHLERTNNSH